MSNSVSNPVIDNLTNWQTDADGADTNPPTNSTQMSDGAAGDLDGELRRLKSEIRFESVRKSWQRYKGLTAFAGGAGPINFVYGSPTQFGVNDNWNLLNVIGRKFQAIHSNGLACWGKISAVSAFVGGGCTVAITPASGGGTLNPTLLEIWL